MVSKVNRRRERGAGEYCRSRAVHACGLLSEKAPKLVAEWTDRVAVHGALFLRLLVTGHILALPRWAFERSDKCG
jgi:hypothetical protein